LRLWHRLSLWSPGEYCRAAGQHGCVPAYRWPHLLSHGKQGANHPVHAIPNHYTSASKNLECVGIEESSILLHLVVQNRADLPMARALRPQLDFLHSPNVCGVCTCHAWMWLDMGWARGWKSKLATFEGIQWWGQPQRIDDELKFEKESKDYLGRGHKHNFLSQNLTFFPLRSECGHTGIFL